MFQFPVEMALAIARVSFERSCHDSKMSGYLGEFQETSLLTMELMSRKYLPSLQACETRGLQNTSKYLELEMGTNYDPKGSKK